MIIIFITPIKCRVAQGLIINGPHDTHGHIPPTPVHDKWESGPVIEHEDYMDHMVGVTRNHMRWYL